MTNDMPTVAQLQALANSNKGKDLNTALGICDVAHAKGFMDKATQAAADVKAACQLVDAKLVNSYVAPEQAVQDLSYKIEFQANKITKNNDLVVKYQSTKAYEEARETVDKCNATDNHVFKYLPTTNPVEACNMLKDNIKNFSYSPEQVSQLLGEDIVGQTSASRPDYTKTRAYNQAKAAEQTCDKSGNTKFDLLVTNDVAGTCAAVKATLNELEQKSHTQIDGSSTNTQQLPGKPKQVIHRNY